MAKNTGIKYEELVRDIYQAFVDCDDENVGYHPIKVKHNVSVVGKSGVEHQIDVYWEFELAGTIYKTIVEVKDWSSPVKKEQLLTFNSLLEDIPGHPKGMYVSRSGFQSGALDYAKAQGIHLVIIDKNDSSMKINFRHVTTYYENVYLVFNDSLFDENPNLLDKATNKLKDMEYTEVYLYTPYGARIPLSDLVHRDAVPYYYEPDNQRRLVKKALPNNWFCEINLEETTLVRIGEYGYSCYNQSEYAVVAISNVADYVISNLLEDKQHLYSQKNKQIIKRHE